VIDNRATQLGSLTRRACEDVGVLAHVSIQCADAKASRAFYEAVLEPLGCRALIVHGDYVGFGRDRSDSLFFIGPVDTPGGPHDDVHIAFRAVTREAVDAFVDVARARGAAVLHEPQEWWYAEGYYGGFVRDPDGNNVEAVHVGDT
jgi:catechol 2,3-dioxygenase-like lactoylglutathione lyase family enzyme